jgi:nascent polypeptide-associated complex subunit alpha
MMPNIDPRQMKAMMAKMGIKSTEIPASKVIIESEGKSIIISSPEVTKIEAQGSVSFQISGEVSEQEEHVAIEITADDIDMVSQSTGIKDREKIEETLKEENGDIARAILKLKSETTPA